MLLLTLLSCWRAPLNGKISTWACNLSAPSPFSNFKNSARPTKLALLWLRQRRTSELRAPLASASDETEAPKDEITALAGRPRVRLLISSTRARNRCSRRPRLRKNGSKEGRQKAPLRASLLFLSAICAQREPRVARRQRRQM